MSKKVKVGDGNSKACQCGSWLAHWERLSGRKAAICVEVNCDGHAEAGALVMKADCGDGKWFVIPLCREHNALTGMDIEVVDVATFVPAGTETQSM